MPLKTYLSPLFMHPTSQGVLFLTPSPFSIETCANTCHLKITWKSGPYGLFSGTLLTKNSLDPYLNPLLLISQFSLTWFGLETALVKIQWPLTCQILVLSATLGTSDVSFKASGTPWLGTLCSSLLAPIGFAASLILFVYELLVSSPPQY